LLFVHFQRSAKRPGREQRRLNTNLLHSSLSSSPLHDFDLHPYSELHLIVRARACKCHPSSAAELPSSPAWRLAPVRHPYYKAFDKAGRLRGLRVSDPRVFGAILKQGTDSVNKAGLVVHDLAGAAAAATESGLLFATDAKARVGGYPLPLLLTCFAAKGQIVLSIHFL
jgi:hypothetical protein